METQSDPNQTALEELRLLSIVIARYESFEFQYRWWLLVILGALITALHAQKISGLRFDEIASTILVLFMLMELILRRTKRKAIWRSGVVEAALRGEAQYDGPAVTKNLTARGPISGLKLLLMEFKVGSLWVFYLGLFIIIQIFAISAPRSVGSP